MRTETSIAGFIGLLTLTSIVGGALAEGYCIACQEPDATYRCVIEGASGGAPGDPRNQIACVKDLAKAGGHKRCSVERFSTDFCRGELRTIANSAAGLSAQPASGAAPATGPQPALSVPAGGSGAVPVDPDLMTAGPKQVESKPAEPTEPVTISDLTADTAEAAKQSLDSAGAAIGNTAKKSWDCVTSIFSDC